MDRFRLFATPSRRAAVLAAMLAALLAVVVTAGCSSSDSSSAQQEATPTPDVSGTTLRIAAGSEIQDMEPILQDAEQQLGIDIELSYMGTLDGTEAVMGGDASDYDATWFPSNAYMALFDSKAQLVDQETSIMRTPVVLGIKPEKAAELGFDSASPTWAQIVDAAADGSFSYGMTSPVSSNSGFSTLVELATALSGTGSAITEQDIDKVKGDLTRFAAGQKLNSGSSGWLMEAYRNDPSAVDGVFNYESLILQEGNLVEVIPQDGVITADYPLTLLTSASDDAKAAYQALVDYLKSADVQQRIADETHRRTDATSADDATAAFEIPFPNRLETVHALLSTWVSEVRKPANMVLEIDTSGSMEGTRLAELKAALLALTDTSGDGSDSLLTFQPRETVQFIEFSHVIKSRLNATIDASGDLSQVTSYINGLQANGDTAVYDTLADALTEAAATRSDANATSVVLFSDGESNTGMLFSQFQDWYTANTQVHGIPVYAILFGEANVQEMQALADLTGGKVFDAENGDLTAAFKEIRGYL